MFSLMKINLIEWKLGFLILYGYYKQTFFLFLIIFFLLSVPSIFPFTSWQKRNWHNQFLCGKHACSREMCSFILALTRFCRNFHFYFSPCQWSIIKFFFLSVDIISRRKYFSWDVKKFIRIFNEISLRIPWWQLSNEWDFSKSN